MIMKPDDFMHSTGGETVDELAHSAIRLAHDAIERFPDMKRKHMFIAGGAAISSALVVAAGVAVARRIRAGAKPEDAVQSVTEDEIEGLRLVERTPYRPPNGRHAAGDADDAEDTDAIVEADPASDAADRATGS